MHALFFSLVLLLAACGGSSRTSPKPSNQSSAVDPGVPAGACGEQACPSGQTCQHVDDCHDEPDPSQHCLGYACMPDPDASYPCAEPCPSGQSCQQADTCQDEPDGTRRCMGLVYTCQPEPSH